MERLPELLQILNELEKGRWEALKDTSLIADVETFGVQMQELGEKYNYQGLANWGEKLQTEASLFELDALKKTMEVFPNIIENIESIIKGDL